jgi:hypothetical protein
MVITLKAPNRAQFAYGLGKCITYGVEYELLDDLTVELTSSDEMRLIKMCVAFRAKPLSIKKTSEVGGDLPKHEVQYARTHRKIPTTRR